MKGITMIEPACMEVSEGFEQERDTRGRGITTTGIFLVYVNPQRVTKYVSIS